MGGNFINYQEYKTSIPLACKTYGNSVEGMKYVSSSSTTFVRNIRRSDKYLTTSAEDM
jgi:hypothetical protein